MAGLCSIPWRWISGILGIMCLLLLASLGILLTNPFHKPSIESTISPGTITEYQEDSDYCSCQERWIGYRCNCYFISSELKTWKESNDFCDFWNSTLLWMHKTDELHFMKFSARFYWIGVTYNKAHGAWMWLNGSPVSQDLLSLFPTANSKKCIAYRPEPLVWETSCELKNFFICKQQLI